MSISGLVTRLRPFLALTGVVVFAACTDGESREAEEKMETGVERLGDRMERAGDIVQQELIELRQKVERELDEIRNETEWEPRARARLESVELEIEELEREAVSTGAETAEATRRTTRELREEAADLRSRLDALTEKSGRELEEAREDLAEDLAFLAYRVRQEIRELDGGSRVDVDTTASDASRR